MEPLPALHPVGGDLRGGHLSERGRHPALAARVGVRRKHELVAALRLLEAFREERKHFGPRPLRGFAADGDRDAPQPAQRNALFSFSKNPSSARYVSSSVERPNCSSRCRCSSVNRRGTATLTSTRWSPRPNPCSTGIPRPRSTRISPGCVPSGNSSSVSPS